MFNKLVSQLPFNPSLVGQVSFYAKRMHEEASIRRAGFLLVALAMFIQMFAIVAPPERSLAASDNHIINGLTSRDGIIAAWNAPGSDIPAIYGKFGVTLADIQKLPQDPNDTVHSGDGTDWWSIGRNSLEMYSGVQQHFKDSEIAITISPSLTVYMRQLHSWDIKNTSSTYQAWKGVKADGTAFWIMKDCGNYLQVGKFTPKTPVLDVRKSIKDGATALKPGDSLTYRFEYRNSAADSLATDAALTDTLDLTNYDVVTKPDGATISGNTFTLPLGNLQQTPNYNVAELTVRLKNPYPGAKTLCNSVKMTASNASEATGGPACVTVDTPTPPPTAPTVLCSLTTTDVNKTTRTATLKTAVTSTDASATHIQDYTYDFGDHSSILKHTNAALSDTTTHTYAAGDYQAKVTVHFTGTGLNGTQSTDCTGAISFEGDNPLGQLKKVKNVTQNLEGDAAVSSTVHAGDVLEYSLITSNTQSFSRKDVTVTDYIGDLLDYATLDTTYLNQQGGSFDTATKKVTWNGVVIGANQDNIKTFRIAMKNPLPTTNQPSNVSGTFDCKISNQYGNEITMQVACPAVKGIESIPNTGPGTSALFGFVVTAVVGYFFARSRLLAKELDIIRSEYTATGAY